MAEPTHSGEKMSITKSATEIQTPNPRNVARDARPTSLFRQLLHRPLAFTCLLILAIIILSAAFAPLVAPYSPYASNFTSILKGPNAHYLLGTDELGRDILSRLLFGGGPTLLAAGEATVIAVAIGTVLGVIAGYRRGSIDRALSIWGDLLLAMPVLVVLIVVVSVFPSSPYPAMIPLGLLLSAAPMRVLRSVTLSVREELYIDAARVSGLSHREIVMRHVLPRIRGPIVVQTTLVAAVAVILASGLAFLGFGIHVPQPSWGSMVAEAASEYQQQPWYLVPTGGIIAVTVLCLGLIGDGVRDIVAEQWTGVSTKRKKTRRVKRPDNENQAPEEYWADSTTTVLAVRDLHVSVDDRNGVSVPIVDGVDFELSRGRTLAIVGESGAGKSMTARAILGIVPEACQVDGHARLNDQDLIGASRQLLAELRGKRISFISQEATASLDPTQTIGSALREVIRHYKKLSKKEANLEVLALLRRVQLRDPERVVGLFPHQISGGMAQRVTIARALAGNPQVLIADEPTTALDATVQIGILALLRTLQATSNIAILLITHDWGVVAALADDVLVMYAGQAVEMGTAESVFDHPLHPYTDALLCSDPRKATPGETLVAIAGNVPRPGSWPTGCRFAPRCQQATVECQVKDIEMLRVKPGHSSRCIHMNELVGELEQ